MGLSADDGAVLKNFYPAGRIGTGACIIDFLASVEMIMIDISTTWLARHAGKRSEKTIFDLNDTKRMIRYFEHHACSIQHNYRKCLT